MDVRSSQDSQGWITYSTFSRPAEHSESESVVELLPEDSAEDVDSQLELLPLLTITPASVDSDRGGTITFSSTVGVFSSRSIFWNTIQVNKRFRSSLGRKLFKIHFTYFLTDSNWHQIRYQQKTKVTKHHSWASGALRAAWRESNSETYKTPFLATF